MPRRNIILFGALLLFTWLPLACGGDLVVEQSSPISFEKETVKLDSGSCANEARLISLGNTFTSLVALIAVAEDSRSNQFRISWDAEMVSDAAGTLVVPAGGVVTIPFSFDVSGEGLDPPLIWTVLVQGVSSGRSAEFIGQFLCEE